MNRGCRAEASFTPINPQGRFARSERPRLKSTEVRLAKLRGWNPETPIKQDRKGTGGTAILGAFFVDLALTAIGLDL